MYKMYYANIETGVNFIEYGFKHYINKREKFLEEQDWAEIWYTLPLKFSFREFWECLRRNYYWNTKGLAI